MLGIDRQREVGNGHDKTLFERGNWRFVEGAGSHRLRDRVFLRQPVLQHEVGQQRPSDSAPAPAVDEHGPIAGPAQDPEGATT